ncbi:GNAT family N-acetyltransferase [Aspergillus undulatus]|uniref:GNAT family N-acetyltransferase n=1 Tax=Aspergillus undulatus TaxID=1810928 RepID=UPI003CCDF0B8
MSRPLGDPVTLPAATRPSHTTLTGRTVKLVPLTVQHADDLFPLVNNTHPDQTSLWDYMPAEGPYSESDFAKFKSDISAKATSTDPLFFAVLNIDTRHPQGEGEEEKALGYIALMNIVPDHLRLEIGHVLFTKPLQRTVEATEAIYLLLKHSIEDLGYRRVEWKCNSLNAPSKRAAERLGFTLEGVFRQHLVVKGRSRDTAWLSLLREEWWGIRDLKGALEGWLAEGNFGEGGRQLRRLEEFRSV